MILVTGANGKIGRELVRILAPRAEPVRAMVRSRARATGVEGLGVPLVVGDFERPATLAPVFAGVDRLFLVSSTSPRVAELHANAVEAARAAGVGHVVRVSSLGAARDAPTSMQRWHGEAEAVLAASGLAYTHLRPAYFMQSTRIFAPATAARGTITVPAGDGRIGMVDLRDVAAVAAEVLTSGDRERHRGAAYSLTGPEALSFAEVAARLGAAIGRPVRYQEAPPPQVRDGMVRAGLAEWLADALLEFYRHTAAGGFDLVTDDVRRVAGRPPRSFDQFAREFAAHFRGDEGGSE
jgi:uncharacterized protein YbjT (DUF2867 family)